VNNNNVQFDISDLEKVLRKTVEYLKIKFWVINFKIHHVVY
jgi:hypothetical protein